MFIVFPVSPSFRPHLLSSPILPSSLFSPLFCRLHHFPVRGYSRRTCVIGAIREHRFFLPSGIHPHIFKLWNSSSFYYHKSNLLFPFIYPLLPICPFSLTSSSILFKILFLCFLYLSQSTVLSSRTLSYRLSLHSKYYNIYYLISHLSRILYLFSILYIKIYNIISSSSSIFSTFISLLYIS